MGYAPRVGVALDVTGDQRFVMVRLAEVNQAPGAGQLVVVDNWFEELKAKMGTDRK